MISLSLVHWTQRLFLFALAIFKDQSLGLIPISVSQRKGVEYRHELDSGRMISDLDGITSRSHTLHVKKDSDRYYDDDGDEEEEDGEEWSKVRVPRRGASRRSRFDEQEQTSSSDQADRYYSRRDDYYEKDGDQYYDDVFDEDDFLDDDDDEEDYDEDDEEYDLFSDVVIPNALLDSIDPDGAADRFPELARDPRFWFDIVLFIVALNFLSELGPRNPSYFPWTDIPWQSM